MAKRQIEAVLFDLGETLLTFGRLDRTEVSIQAARCAYEYLKKLNQPVGSFGAYRFFHLWGMRWQVFKSMVTGNDFNSLEVLKAFGRKKGYELTESQWQEMNWRWYESLSKLGHVVPGSIAALKQLTDLGLKLGILSNTFVHRTSLERHLANEGLLEYFPLRMYSYEYPWRKPDVRLFNAAAEKIGVEPEKIVYVGDRLDCDVDGALKAGMLPILIRAYTNKDKTLPAGIEYIQDNTELVAAIQKRCDLPVNTIKNEAKPTHDVCRQR